MAVGQNKMEVLTINKLLDLKQNSAQVKKSSVNVNI